MKSKYNYKFGTLKTLLLSLLMAATSFGVPDDGNPATIRARFSWVQPVAVPVVTKYKVTIWKSGQAPEQGKVIEVPSAPQVGNNVLGEIIEDGFVQGETYQAHIKAASDLDESDPSELLTFRIPVIIPSPTLPKVEIQVSADLSVWKTIAYIPLNEDQRFVRAKIAMMNP